MKITFLILTLSLAVSANVQTSRIIFSSGPLFGEGPTNVYTIEARKGSTPVTIAEDLRADDFDWSADGKKIVYCKISGIQWSDIWVMNSDGSNQQEILQQPREMGVDHRTGKPETVEARFFHNPQWLPDGQSISYWNEAAGLVFMRIPDKIERVISHSDARRILTTGYLENLDWTPDGHILYSGEWFGKFMTWNPYGKNEKPRIIADDITGIRPKMSPDGTRIAYVGDWRDWDRNHYYAIWTMNADGSKPEFIIEAASSQICWSPDSRKIAIVGGKPDSWDDVFIKIIDVEDGSSFILLDSESYPSSLAWSPWLFDDTPTAIKSVSWGTVKNEAR